jgi:hypothetical protein
MDPSLAAPLATLAGAISTAILMWASYNFPAGRHRPGGERDDAPEDETEEKPARKPQTRSPRSRKVKDDDDGIGP